LEIDHNALHHQDEISARVSLLEDRPSSFRQSHVSVLNHKHLPAPEIPATREERWASKFDRPSLVVHNAAGVDP
jgi:hypothetical protein